MANQGFDYDAFRDLLEGVSVIGRLAKDEKAFREAYEAFRSSKAKEFQAILKRLGLFPRCRVVCEWIRIKECIFLCLELCGPPKPYKEVPNPRLLAEAIVRITSNEKLVHELVEVLEKRNRDAFERIVNEYKLGPLCHLFCHWLCVVRFRLICRWVCSPIQIERPNLADELRLAGQALRRLLEHKDAFDRAVAASNAGDAEKLAEVIRGADLIRFCYAICEWFCSWRCTLVCLTLCREFPLEPIKNQLEEALAFAKATQRLAHKPAEVERLIAAVSSGDGKAWGALLKELELHRFCIQLCHWVCYLICRRFCILICPPEGLYPVFTSIGVYDYIADVNSGLGGNGLTKADNRAFFSTLRLNGILTQTLGGQPMEYRFETAPTDAAGNLTGAWTPVLPAQVGRTEIGHWERFNPFPIPHMDTKKYTVNGIVGPNELVATIAADGWILVPQENNAFTATGAFASNGNMIELISQSLAPFTPADQTGVLAGGPAAHPLVQDVYFGIRMRIRQQGNAATETDGGTCVHLAIDNTLYDNITLHPDWDGGLQPPGRLAVCMVDIAELIAHPCGNIANQLTVLFTGAHPNLDPNGVSIVMTGPGGPFAFTLPAIPETGDWFGTATPTFSVASLAPCAYLVTLQVGVLLTNGDSVPSPLIDQIAFCK